MSSTALGFRPLAEADFTVLVEWFNRPHVYAWRGRCGAPDGIGGPGDDAATLDEVDAHYGESAEDRHERPFVIERDGRAIGLIQWYLVADYP